MSENLPPPRAVNLPSIRRLPLYLNELQKLRGEGREVISAAHLAEMTGQVIPVVKKDIALTGVTGKTGVGYGVDSLIQSIRECIGWDTPCRAILAGAGRLGAAIISHREFRAQNLHIIAAFDTDSAKIGTVVHGVEILPLEKLVETASFSHIETGVLTVPSDAAQTVADLFVRAGIKRIWSFAERVLSVPGDVVVQREALSSGFAELLVRSRAFKPVKNFENL